MSLRRSHIFHFVFSNVNVRNFSVNYIRKIYMHEESINKKKIRLRVLLIQNKIKIHICFFFVCRDGVEFVLIPLFFERKLDLIFHAKSTFFF